MSYAGPSNFAKIMIIKQRKDASARILGSESEHRVEGKVVGLNYFESVYSPDLTANFLVLDTGGTVEDKDGQPGTLKDALPIEGFEEVLMRIGAGSGNLVFDDRESFGSNVRSFRITGSPTTTDTGNKQAAFFPMVSSVSFHSANNPIKDVYPEALISDIVFKILKNKKLKISGIRNANIVGVYNPLDKGRHNIETTKNKIKLIGDNQPSFDTILKLCKKAQPMDGDPGYFFFQTKTGFRFESIHGMIKRGIEAYGRGDGGYKASRTYRYGSLLEANLNNDENNFKILKPPVIRRDQDQITAIRNGQYKVRVCTMNPTTGNYEEKIIKVDNNPSGTLGNINNENAQNEQNNGSNDNDKFCKTFSYVLNYDKAEESVVDNPSEYEPRAMMKYGMLHSQLIDIQIPCNVNLEAGTVIRLLFENITQGNKLETAYNQHRSGFYLILHLCHHFDSSNSFTSLTLARDGYGLYNTIK